MHVILPSVRGSLTSCSAAQWAPPKIGQLVNPMHNINDNFEVKGIASAEEKRERVEKPKIGQLVNPMHNINDNSI